MNERDNKRHGSVKAVVIMAVIAIIFAALTVAGLIYFRMQLAAAEVTEEEYREYRYHYAFIADYNQDSFWNEVYEGAKARGEEKGIYLQKFGEDLAVDYTRVDLMKMAVASGVDGIILEGGEDPGLIDLINEAEEKHIPVITVLADSYGSRRQSFVGIGSYNLGREYGRQIVRIATKKTKRVLVLMDSNQDNSSQNILYNGLKETLSNEGNHLELSVDTMAIDNESTFSAEEAIRDIFLSNEILPDILICLDERNTLSAYQAVVDYNRVGKVNILGYYTSDSILNAISRNVIAATITVDSRQMGMLSVDALSEYIETGHVSDYVVMDVSTVTANNVGEYIEDMAEHEEK